MNIVNNVNIVVSLTPSISLHCMMFFDCISTPIIVCYISAVTQSSPFIPLYILLIHHIYIISMPSNYRGQIDGIILCSLQQSLGF